MTLLSNRIAKANRIEQALIKAFGSPEDALAHLTVEDPVLASILPKFWEEFALAIGEAKGPSEDTQALIIATLRGRVAARSEVSDPLAGLPS